MYVVSFNIFQDHVFYYWTVREKKDVIIVERTVVDRI